MVTNGAVTTTKAATEGGIKIGEHEAEERGTILITETIIQNALYVTRQIMNQEIASFVVKDAKFQIILRRIAGFKIEIRLISQSRMETRK